MQLDFETYVIVGAAIFISDDLRPHFYELYTNNEAITTISSLNDDLMLCTSFKLSSYSLVDPRCPLQDYTLYIIYLINGKISDSLEFRVDKIILSHNQGLYLYNDTLAVLSIQHQTNHIYQIVDGSIQFLRSIGRFCCDEEAFLFNSSLNTGSNNRAFREPTINISGYGP